MRSCFTFLSVIILTCFILFMLLPLMGLSRAAYAGDHGDTDALDYRVNTENLGGVYKLLGDMYNDNRTLFAVVTTVWMALLGGIIAIVADYILRFIFATSSGAAGGK